MKTLKLTFAAALAALATAQPSQADRVTLLLGSYHAGASSQYEEFNPGVFYTWERPKVDLSLGAYRNSYGKLSVAAAVAKPLWRWEDGAFSVFGGLAHYPDNGRNFVTHLGSDVVVLAGLQVRYRNVVVQALPYDEGSANALLTFGLTFEVGR